MRRRAGRVVLLFGLLTAGLLGCKRRESLEAEPLVIHDAATATQGADVSADVGAVAAEEMVVIPAGTFPMGCSNCDLRARPVHQVKVSSFSMDVTEVTVDRYAACVRAGKCTPAAAGQWCNAGVSGRGNHPINCVDWNQATAYCAWKGKRLPTEEEWEYGARGADGRRFPWGNEEEARQLCWNGRANDQGTGNRKSTCPVGSYPAGKSPFGLLDMAGNVSEWTSSHPSEDYSKPIDKAERVYRGEGWNASILLQSGGYRYGLAPTSEDKERGFRCAR